MSELERTLSLIEAGQFESVEDRWLNHISKRPLELGFCYAVLESLCDAEEAERARFLLDLLEEQLQETGSWVELLAVLEQTGLRFREPAELNSAVVETLRRRYSNSPNLDGLIEKVGLLRAIEDTPKMWKKTRRLVDLMQFDQGSVVRMKGKGAGRVTEVNLDLESFKLDLENHPGLRVGFAAAPKMLEPLAPGHFLRRKIEDPESLKRQAEDSPGDTLVALLESAGRPLGASQIKQHLGSLVPAKKWSTWWTEARQHPRVLSAGSSARQKYSCASSSDHALEAVRETFLGADLEEQLKLYRKEARRSPELAKYMEEQLTAEADAALDSDLATALTIQDALERQGAAQAGRWSASRIVEQAENLPALVTSIADRSLRERIYELAVDSRPNWSKDLGRAMSVETDPRMLSTLADRLLEHDRAALNQALEMFTSQPRKHPQGFVWLVETFDREALTGELNPLRSLRQCFDAFHQPEFDRMQNRLTKALDGTPAGAMIRRLSESQAESASKAIARAPIEEHARELLQRALEHCFPHLGGKQEEQLYATKQSIEKRRKELKNLIEVEIPANRKAIEEARELGDLRENFEYKSARQRHEYLNARVEKLQGDLDRVRPFNPDELGSDEVRIGSRVSLRAASGAELSLTIMGPWESDPDQGIISYASDLGGELLGLAVGDPVVVEGESYEIAEISTS